MQLEQTNFSSKLITLCVKEVLNSLAPCCVIWGDSNEETGYEVQDSHVNSESGAIRSTREQSSQNQLLGCRRAFAGVDCELFDYYDGGYG